jgi:3-hydroxyacyl-CoA dehydrogenase
MSSPETRVTLIGAGTIGISLAALHLTHLHSPESLTIVDTRPDLAGVVKDQLNKIIPKHLGHQISKINLTTNLTDAVKEATIVQESGPEDLYFKQSLWAEVEKHAPRNALFWTSTTGIPASLQNKSMQDKSRLIVVHPFNPPHILPLLEIVPAPETSQTVIDATFAFWRNRGRQPILIRKEAKGFVAGRLAWALLREAVHLVNEDVVTVEELDRIMENSMGPRWAYAGPFKSFHTGGGPGGLEALMKNVGGSVQACWDDAGRVNIGEDWEQKIFYQTREAYKEVDLDERDRAMRRIFDAVAEEKSRSS